MAGMGMGSGVLEIVARDFDSSLQFLQRELDGVGVLVLRRQHRAGGHDLDEVGAASKLAAGCGANLIGSVRNLIHAGIILYASGGDR